MTNRTSILVARLVPLAILAALALGACPQSPAQAQSQDRNQAAPLIPRNILDAPASHDYVTISPDAKYLAYIAPSENSVANIWIEDLSTHQNLFFTHSDHR